MNYKRVVAMVGAALFLLTFVPYNVIYKNKNMGPTFYVFTIFAIALAKSSVLSCVTFFSRNILPFLYFFFYLYRNYSFFFMGG